MEFEKSRHPELRGEWGWKPAHILLTKLCTAPWHDAGSTQRNGHPTVSFTKTSDQLSTLCIGGSIQIALRGSIQLSLFLILSCFSKHIALPHHL